MKHYQTAVIGCGAIHQNHLDAIADCPQADLYAVCDIDAAQGEKTAASANCKLFTSFDEVLEDPTIDVVHLCTPHYLHAPHGDCCYESRQRRPDGETHGDEHL